MSGIIWTIKYYKIEFVFNVPSRWSCGRYQNNQDWHDPSHAVNQNHTRGTSYVNTSRSRHQDHHYWRRWWTSDCWRTRWDYEHVWCWNNGMSLISKQHWIECVVYAGSQPLLRNQLIVSFDESRRFPFDQLPAVISSQLCHSTAGERFFINLMRLINLNRGLRKFWRT